MTESVFTNNQNNEDTTNQSSYVEALVGPGKKYKDMEALAKSVLDKDNFIETLKTENHETREELKKRLALEEFLKQTNKETNNDLSASRQGLTNANVEREENKETARGNTPAIDKNELASIVREVLSKETTKATRAANIEATKQELIRTWGDNYVAVLSEKVKDLGVNSEFLDDVAARSPKAFLSLVGVQSNQTPRNQQAQGNNNPPPSSRNTSAAPITNETVDGINTKRYYDRLRKEDPKSYYSANVQVRMHNDALKLGEKFFNS